MPLARDYAQRAVELDSALADAHLAVAHVALALEHDYSAAGRGCERAIALDPGHVDARHYYGIYLLNCARFEDAEVEIKRALAVDPLNAPAHMTLGRVYMSLGQAERGVRHLRDALELSPGFTYASEQLVRAYLALGRHDEAITEAERTAGAGGTRELAVLAYAYAVSGRRSEAISIVRRLTDESDRYPPPIHIAMAFAGLGDVDEAFVWLERGYAEHDPHIMGLPVLPAFVPLRSDPRFLDLVRRMGLAAEPGARTVQS
jgi:tetratricopeptide (TPR) repeat protein